MENESTAKEVLNPHAEMYRERLKAHLRAGIPGFLMGFVFVLAMFVVIYVAGGKVSEHSLPDNVSAILEAIFAAFAVGVFGAGMPYGWRLMNQFFGGRSIEGEISIVIFLFLLKLVVGWGIGMVAYPVMMAYYFIRSQGTKHKVKMWAVIIICTLALFYALLGIYAIASV